MSAQPGQICVPDPRYPAYFMEFCKNSDHARPAVLLARESAHPADDGFDHGCGLLGHQRVAGAGNHDDAGARAQLVGDLVPQSIGIINAGPRRVLSDPGEQPPCRSPAPSRERPPAEGDRNVSAGRCPVMRVLAPIGLRTVF